MLAVIIFAGTSVFAQKTTEDKVPSAVKQTFLKKFPKDTNVKWEMEKKDYEVNFKMTNPAASSGVSRLSQKIVN